MSPQNGQQIGSYEITGLLGKGGMGEVYRARDTKLKRDVAVKILPDEFSCDAERASRFRREAEVLASLNHPNIAAIYDLQEANDTCFLVLELVEGETLADRLQRGRIPVEEALKIAKRICEALEAAHEKGIIHRDLKPANIKVTKDGAVKVLDFGLARMREAEGDATTLSHSPTLMSAASAPGMIMGTAAYMSPEQAKGQEVDRTADVWAFGCVLYEMLTGHIVFEGETVGEILGGVFQTEPDWTRLPPDTPESIRRLVRRCLRKDRRLRVRDIGDAGIEIEDVRRETEPEGPVVVPASRRRERFVWFSALAFVTLVAATAMLWELPPTLPLPEARLEINTPSTPDPFSLAISPDGRRIVFVATSEGQARLWLRSMDSVSARVLTGTDGAAYPFWSPDSRSVGFFANARLKRIDIDGGLVQTLADAPLGRGGSWNRDGTILFAPGVSSAIFRTSATGDAVVQVTRLEADALSHRFPEFLSDGRLFLYYVWSSKAQGVHIGSLDGSSTKRILEADAAAVVASSGQLLFVRQTTLFAQNFDPARLTLIGNPFPVAEQVLTDLSTSVSAISASMAGSIGYRMGSSSGQRQFVWFDRSGKELGKVGEPDSAGPTNPALSPDGHRVALQRVVNGNPDIWFLELTGLLTRFTFDATNAFAAIWSPDGSRVVFNSNPNRSNSNRVNDLYQKPASGAGAEELLLPSPQLKTPLDWSSDGRFVLYRSADPEMGWNLWALPMDGDRKPFPVVRTNSDERDGQFSPDGRWIAYQSNASGRFEIWVQPFPGREGQVPKWQISNNGGAQVRWRHDGKELFYIAPDGRLMAVPISFSDGQAIDRGAPVALFPTRLGGAVQTNSTQQYMVSPDGQRFLMNTVTEEATPPITIILNGKLRP